MDRLITCAKRLLKNMLCDKKLFHSSFYKIKVLTKVYKYFFVFSASGKKGKKKKGQTVSLNAFLGTDSPTYSPTPHSKTDWADEDDDLGPVDCKGNY